MVFAGIPALLASRPIVSAWAIACLPVPWGALTIDLPVAGRSRAFRGTLDVMGDIDELIASQPLAVRRGMVARRGRHLQYLTISWNSAECLVARELQSGALEAEARQTHVCAYLSAILVVGLGLNAAFGWWWADPVAALGMAPLIAREGVDAVRGRTCCD